MSHGMVRTTGTIWLEVEGWREGIRAARSGVELLIAGVAVRSTADRITLRGHWLALIGTGFGDTLPKRRLSGLGVGDARFGLIARGATGGAGPGGWSTAGACSGTHAGIAVHPGAACGGIRAHASACGIHGSHAGVARCRRTATLHRAGFGTAAARGSGIVISLVATARGHGDHRERAEEQWSPFHTVTSNVRWDISPAAPHPITEGR